MVSLTNSKLRVLEVFLIVAALASAALLAQPDFDWAESPLYEAVNSGDLEMVLAVGKVSKNVDWPDRRKATALMYAAAAGDLPLVEALLARGADLEAKDKYGGTALHYACGTMMGNPYPQPDMIRFLLSRGVKVDVVDEEGFTPLHRAVSAMDPSPEGVAAVLEGAPDVNLATKYGDSALDLANEFGREETARLLMAAGAAPGQAQEAPTEPSEVWSSPLTSATPPDPELFSGVALPLGLVNWIPTAEMLEAAGIELDSEEEAYSPPRLSVSLGPLREEAESPECVERRRQHRQKWEGDVSPGVVAAGRSWYRYVGSAIGLPAVRLKLDYGQGELEQYSTDGTDEESLCVLGSGYWQVAAGRLDGLHLVDIAGIEYILQLVRGQLPADFREAMAEALMYPLAGPDPDGLLTMISEAGEFPVLLRVSAP